MSEPAGDVYVTDVWPVIASMGMLMCFYMTAAVKHMLVCDVMKTHTVAVWHKREGSIPMFLHYPDTGGNDSVNVLVNLQITFAFTYCTWILLSNNPMFHLYLWEAFIDRVWIWYLQSTYSQQHPKVIVKKKKKLNLKPSVSVCDHWFFFHVLNGQAKNILYCFWVQACFWTDLYIHLSSTCIYFLWYKKC